MVERVQHRLLALYTSGSGSSSGPIFPGPPSRSVPNVALSDHTRLSRKERMDIRYSAKKSMKQEGLEGCKEEGPKIEAEVDD